MNLGLEAGLATTGLFVGMLVCTEIGRRIGIARIARDPEGPTKGVATAEGAMLALLGLLIAFTFSGAASRFEDRRHLIAAETNAIGTAYLRIELLPADSQPAIRDLFRRYTDVRSITYQNVADEGATMAKLAEGGALQREIWTKALIAARRAEASPQAAMLLLPAVNEMIDITETREVATRIHPPAIIFVLLSGLSLVSALMVGYGTASSSRSWFHAAIFAAVLSVTVYVIVDLEFPRRGLIRVDAADESLVELRRSMQ